MKPYLGKSMKEYNGIKPHYYDKIYTPDEVYENPKLIDIQIFFEKLNNERIAANKAFVCGKV